MEVVRDKNRVKINCNLDRLCVLGTSIKYDPNFYKEWVVLSWGQKALQNTSKCVLDMILAYQSRLSRLGPGEASFYGWQKTKIHNRFIWTAYKAFHICFLPTQ